MTAAYASRQLDGLNALLRIAREAKPHADTVTMPRYDPADQFARLLAEMRAAGRARKRKGRR